MQQASAALGHAPFPIDRHLSGIGRSIHHGHRPGTTSGNVVDTTHIPRMTECGRNRRIVPQPGTVLLTREVNETLKAQEQ